MRKLLLHPGAVKVISFLENEGFCAYVVGGCVRDLLMQHVPKDWDITTDAEPEDILRCFSGYKTLKTGMRHGTITVFINGMPIEITTHRIDGRYLDVRHPKQVTFTKKLEDDLKRRDFTINAMAYHPDGHLYDFFDGQMDLKKCLIRAVGEPDVRFSEDALRIMRALRFSAQLSFDIEPDTARSIHKNAHLLSFIARERVGEEFVKLLLSDKVSDILYNYWDVFTLFLPMVEKPDQETFASLDKIPPDLIVRLALLLIRDFQNNNSINSICHHTQQILLSLALSKKTVQNVINLLLAMKDQKSTCRIELKQMLHRYGRNTLDQLWKIWKIDDGKTSEEKKRTEKLYDTYQQIFQKKECFHLKDLAVNGSDLMNFGVEDGKEIGLWLNRLLSLVIDEKLENRKKVLLSYIDHQKNATKR